MDFSRPRYVVTEIRRGMGLSKYSAVYWQFIGWDTAEDTLQWSNEIINTLTTRLGDIAAFALPKHNERVLAVMNEAGQVYEQTKDGRLVPISIELATAINKVSATLNEKFDPSKELLEKLENLEADKEIEKLGPLYDEEEE